ncbi:MAG: T9SS type A sorting domain-containing protein [Bacteroidales bacterium]|nr:T9SS type A sorting domain-containing protein [Bacteroidales bacterium]
MLIRRHIILLPVYPFYLTYILLFVYLQNYSQETSVTDYDSNTYTTITIGNQTWMAENLKVIHYSDGRALIDVTGLGELNLNDMSRYYFYYNDNSSYANHYGCLYTWYTAINGTKGDSNNFAPIQGICPSGWHIPSDADWQQLEVYLGMDSLVAYKSTCIADERSWNLGDLLKVGGSSGFEAKYAGVRDIDGSYTGMGNIAEFLTSFGQRMSNETIDSYTRLYYLLSSDMRLLCHYHATTAAYSVRCLKNQTVSSYSRLNEVIRLSVKPDPVKSEMNIIFSLTNPSQITLEIFNISGIKLNTLLYKAACETGQNQKSFNVTNLNAGLYLLHFTSNNGASINKLVIKQ